MVEGKIKREQLGQSKGSVAHQAMVAFVTPPTDEHDFHPFHMLFFARTREDKNNKDGENPSPKIHHLFLWFVWRRGWPVTQKQLRRVLQRHRLVPRHCSQEL